MKQEISAAAHFLSSIFLSDTPASQITSFKQHLTTALETKYRDHWHETTPTLGQAYRCIRVCPEEPLDPLLTQACRGASLPPDVLMLGLELTLWVDPREVMCKLGDLKCMYHTVAKGESLTPSTPDPEELDHLLEQGRELYQRKQDVSFAGSSGSSSYYPPSPHQRISSVRGAVVIQGTVNAQSCLYNGQHAGYQDDHSGMHHHHHHHLPGSPSRTSMHGGQGGSQTSPTPEQLQQQMLHPPPPPLFSDPPPSQPPVTYSNGSYSISSSSSINGSNFNNSSSSNYTSNSVNSSPSSKLSRARHRESQAIEIKS